MRKTWVVKRPDPERDPWLGPVNLDTVETRASSPELVKERVREEEWMTILRRPRVSKCL